MTDAQMLRLVPGQVIVSPTGRHRTILAVHHADNVRRVDAYVAILRCSWTHRAHTILNKQLLRQYRVTKTILCIKRWKIVKKCLVDIDDVGAPPCATCCDVIGNFQ
jgi:hypothetical protein